ncbi:MAG: trehalose-phosphatase [bacterium]
MKKLTRDILAAAIDGKKGILLMVDFDGTLSPIAKSPASAVLPESAKKPLARVASCRHAAAAVISGRPLADIAARVGIPGIIYCGSHGLEAHGPGIEWSRGSKNPSMELADIMRFFREKLQGIKGIFFEEKGDSSALHYRNCGKTGLERLLDSLAEAEKRGLMNGLRVKPGKKVLEFCPNELYVFDKGFAAGMLISHFADYFPIAVGDDRTDEDMFKAVAGRGISVAVGKKSNLSAQYYLAGPGKTAEMLDWLAQRLEAQC